MRPLTEDRPKPLINVAGKALIDHALDVLDLPEITQTVVNVHYKSEMLEAHLADRNVVFSKEATLLETGGGLKHALRVLESNPVVTLNSDAVWRGPNPVQELLSQHAPMTGATLLLVKADQAVGHRGKGDFDLDEVGQLTRGAKYVYTGLQIIETRPFADFPMSTFSTNLIWDQLIKSNNIKGAVYSGQWCDVGQPSSISLAEKMMGKGV